LNHAEIAGTHGTALGALLYQAAQNKVGLVPEIVVDNQTILSCADAAQVVADNITGRGSKHGYRFLVDR